MTTSKALELAKLSSDLTVDEANNVVTYNGTISATSGYQNLPQTFFTVFGRLTNTNIVISIDV